MITMKFLWSYDPIQLHPAHKGDNKSLTDEPVSFKIDAFNATFKLGYNNRKYTLSVNGTPFDELPYFVDVQEVPEVGHSTVENHDGVNAKRIDYLVFLKGRRNPVSLEHNKRCGQVSLDVCGKPKKSWEAKSLTEAFVIPYNFSHEGHKFTIKIHVDEDGNETEKLDLEIDGILYTKHPFLSSDFGKCHVLTNFLT